MVKATIGGREVPLMLNLNAMERLALIYGAPLDLQAIINRLKEVGVLLTVASVLADEGQEMANTEDPVDRNWIAAHGNGVTHLSMANAIVEAVNASMRMETDDGAGEEEEVDVVLEELKKKEPTGG